MFTRYGILIGISLLTLPAIGHAGLMTEKPWHLDFSSELEMHFTTPLAVQQNWSIAPGVSFGEKGKHTITLTFQIANAWKGADDKEFHMQETLLQMSSADVYRIGELKFSLNNRLYFPTSTEERNNSEIFNWRIWTSTSIPVNSVVSFPLDFRIQVGVYEFSTRTPVTNQTISLMTQEEVTGTLKNDSLNDLFTFRPDVGIALQLHPQVKFVFDMALYFKQTYSPSASSKLLNPALTSDFYINPFFQQTLSISLSDDVSVDVYSRQLGKWMSGTGSSPFHKANISFFTSLNVSL
jgi:hypothetical protein